MARKDAKRKKQHKHPLTWARYAVLAVSSLTVIAICVGLRQCWQSSPADAQVASRSVSTQQPTAQASTQPKQTHDIVAVVNGNDIRHQELAHKSLSRFGEAVLESLVNKHLILQACEKSNVAVTKEDVEAEVASMAKKFGLSTERWLEMLEQERDIKPQQYRSDIVWPTLALRKISSADVTIEDEELREAYATQFGPTVRVLMISTTSREKTDWLRAQAMQDPKEFGTLAKDHSEDKTSAAARGQLPPIRRHVGNPELEEVAFGLAQNEISPVLHIANQYVILMCQEHLPSTALSPEDRVRVSGELRERVRQRKLRSAAAVVFKKLQQAATITNVYNSPELRSQMPGVAATVNDKSITIRELSEYCIERHGLDVLDQAINRRILEQELKRRGLVVNEQDIDGEVSRAARAYGFTSEDGTPDIDEWLTMVTEQDGLSIDLYAADIVWPTVALKKLVGERVKVTEEDMQKGFESNYGQRVECLAIVMSDERRAQEVWDLARANPTDEFFGQLAEQYSIEPVSRSNSGKIPPIRRHGGQPLVEEEAFQLKPGELSSIIATGNRMILLRCLGRTTPVVQEMRAVRDLLYEDIKEKKLRIGMADEFNRLRNSAQIDNFLANTTQSGHAASPAPSTGPHRPGTSGTPQQPVRSAVQPASAELPR